MSIWSEGDIDKLLGLHFPEGSKQRKILLKTCAKIYDLGSVPIVVKSKQRGKKPKKGKKC